MSRRGVVLAVFVCVLGGLFASISCPVLAAPTPAGSEKIRVTTGVPKKDGTFSVKVTWTSDGGTKQTIEATINVVKGESATEKATKLNTALNVELKKFNEPDRGVTIEQGKTAVTNTLLPEVIIMNRSGFHLTKVAPKDKSNEKEEVDTLAASFAEARIQVAMRLVGVPSEGIVEVEIGDSPPVLVETAGKTLAEIEEELSEGLRASGIAVSLGTSEAVLETEIELLPDGRTLRFTSLDAQRVAFSSGDPGIDIAAEFEFQSPIRERASLDLSSTVLLLILGLAAILIVGALWEGTP